MATELTTFNIEFLVRHDDMMDWELGVSKGNLALKVKGGQWVALTPIVDQSQVTIINNNEKYISEGLGCGEV